MAPIFDPREGLRETLVSPLRAGHEKEKERDIYTYDTYKTKIQQCREHHFFIDGAAEGRHKKRECMGDHL